MALARIDDIQLYMGLTAEVADCYAAKKFLDDNGVKFAPYFYQDDEVSVSNMAAISTWKLPGAPEVLDKYPFLIYTEVDFDLPPSQFKRICVYGLDAIVNSDLIAKYAIGR